MAKNVSLQTERQLAIGRGRDDQVPLVTVVTPSYNQTRFLEETILSVLSQEYPRVEYIVIDGGSTDGSADIISKYADRLAYWASERDRGQAHAINKGWARATADIIAYLNSDDLYTPGAISRAVQVLQENPSACMVYSDALLVNEHGDFVRNLRGRPFDIHNVITTEGFVPQPTVFIRRTALDSVGLLDESLHMSMDYDLWVRLGLRYPAIYLPGEHLAKVREHASAKTTAQVQKFALDRRRVLNKMFHQADLPPSICGIRGRAYSAVSYYQASLAAYVGQPREILQPLLRATVESPRYVLERPLQTVGLLARSLIPWWTAKPSPFVVNAWRVINRTT